MKSVKLIAASLILYFGTLQAGNISSIDEPSAYHAFEEVTKNPLAKISRQDGWSIVSLIENGNQVYWFLAPDVHNVTPALMKKTILNKNKGTHKTVIISQCKAPKKKCDSLMKQFKILSKKYK